MVNVPCTTRSTLAVTPLISCGLHLVRSIHTRATSDLGPEVIQGCIPDRLASHLHATAMPTSFLMRPSKSWKRQSLGAEERQHIACLQRGTTLRSLCRVVPLRPSELVPKHKMDRPSSCGEIRSSL